MAAGGVPACVDDYTVDVESEGETDAEDADPMCLVWGGVGKF